MSQLNKTLTATLGVAVNFGGFPVNKYLLSFLLLLPITFLFAQDANEEEAEDVEEVIVTGIRQSLKDAIDIKRSKVGIVDAITAEDFGQFPDGNLAESLARVVGVAVDRSNVEGQQVAVRGFGPEFNLVTLNGRQMPTIPGQYEGGRSFNFGDISSHGISAVEIYKSTDLSLPTGGIGSTINMVTTRPLDVNGRISSVSVAGVYDTTAEGGINNPVEIDFVTASNNGDWGWALSGSLQERSNREEGTQESNWQTTLPYDEAATGLADAGNSYQEARRRLDNAVIRGINGRIDNAIFVPERHGYQIKDNNRIRQNLQATVQRQMGENVRATLDYTYSEVKFSTEGTRFGQWLAGWNSSIAEISTNGAITGLETNMADYGHEASWGKTRNHNNSLGFNLAWDVNDDLELQIDYHESTAAVTGPTLDNSVMLSTGLTSTINANWLGSEGINTYAYGRDYAASEYAIDSATIRDRDSINDMTQYRVFGEWTNSNGRFRDSLTSIEFGFSNIKQDFRDRRAEENYNLSLSTAADLNDSNLTRTSLGGFMDGFGSGFNPKNNYYFGLNVPGIIADARDYLGGQMTPGLTDTNSRVSEELESMYVQLNFESTFRDRPLNTVVALRYEDATNSSVGLSPMPNQIIWDFPGFSFGSNGAVTVQNNQHDGMAVTSAGSALLTDVSDSTTHDLLLPAVSMSWEMSENEVVRFGLSQSIARPALRDLSSVYSLGVEARTNLTASVGNPQLEPMKSTNIDIAYENYYAEGSYFAVNVFHKELEDFITTSEAIENVNGIRDPSMSANGIRAQETVNNFFDLVLARQSACGLSSGAWDYGEDCQQYSATSPFALTDVYWQQLLNYDTFFAGREVMYAWYTWFYNMGGPGNFPWGDCCFVNSAGQYIGPWRAPWDYDNYGTPGADGTDLDGTFVVGSAFPIVSSSTDPLAMFRVSKPVNLKEGGVDGVEVAWQHLMDNGYGVQFNYTAVTGGDVEPDLDNLYSQDALDGFGDSGNFSVFYENETITARLAFNHRGETYAGMGNYFQPLYVEARTHVDVAVSYRVNDNLGFFVDAMNVTDQPTRLFARYSEMLFLSQDHGPVYKAGFRYKF